MSVTPRAPRADLEGPVHRAILNFLRWQYPKAFITHPANERKGLAAGARAKALGQQAGTPDLVMVHDGRTYWFEVKAEGGRVSKEQRYCGELIQANGGFWAVVRSVQDVQECMEEWRADG